MKFQRKPLIIDAIKLTENMTLGEEAGVPGDYLVTVNGKTSIAKQEFFEKHFIPYTAEATINTLVVPENPVEEKEEKYKPWETIPTSDKLCITCNKAKSPDVIDRNTGQCVDCLKMDTTCETCGAAILQLDKIGSVCRKCIGSKKINL